MPLHAQATASRSMQDGQAPPPPEATAAVAAVPAWRQRLDALDFTPEQKGALVFEITSMTPDDRELIVDHDAGVAQEALTRLLASANERHDPRAAIKIAIYDDFSRDDIVDRDEFKDMVHIHCDAESAW